MRCVSIACIVEGEGEVRALPALLWRIATSIDPALSLKICGPIRKKRDLLVRPQELELAVDLAGNLAGSGGALLILLDADKDCPAQLGPALLHRAQTARSDLQSAVVLAKCEYEAWFLAAAESLRGQQGLPAQLAAPADPENVRGAKEWLTSKMPQGQRYKPTVDQLALTKLFDLDQARRADSFDKLYRDVGRLLQEAGGQ